MINEIRILEHQRIIDHLRSKSVLRPHLFDRVIARHERAIKQLQNENRQATEED